MSSLMAALAPREAGSSESLSEPEILERSPRQHGSEEMKVVTRVWERGRGLYLQSSQTPPGLRGAPHSASASGCSGASQGGSVPPAPLCWRRRRGMRGTAAPRTGLGVSQLSPAHWWWQTTSLHLSSQDLAQPAAGTG